MVKQDLVTTRYSPRVGASGLGVYPLTKEQLTTFYRDLWSTSFTEKLANWVLGDPMDSIIGIRWYYGIRSRINQLEDCYVTIGDTAFNGIVGPDEPLISGPSSSEYVHVDCGYVRIPQLYGDFRDIEPYTSIEIYIPFVGVVRLSMKDLISTHYYQETILFLSYNINLITGAAEAVIHRSLSGFDNNANIHFPIIYKAQCQIGVDIPLNVRAKEDMMSRMVTGLAGAGATAGVAYAAPMFAAGAGGAIGSRALAGMNESGSAVGNAAVQGLHNGVQSAISGPAGGRYGGQMDSETSSLASFRPYVRITRKRYSAPDNYKDVVGTPDTRSGYIRDMNGYLKVSAFANDSEPTISKQAMDEIKTILKGGVYTS